MKAKSGFILRTVVGEHILLPVGDAMDGFHGTVVMNDVAALIWEKLQSEVTREELLQAILDEFEVEPSVAARDLDGLLATFRAHDLIEED